MIPIPSIDIFNNRVVRLIKGDFNEITEYPGTPLEYATYFESIGIRRIHLIDLNGAKDGGTCSFEIIKELIEKTDLELEVGGGIRSIERITSLIQLGVAFIIIGTLALKNYEITKQIIKSYPNRIILALDCYGKKIAVEGWQKKTMLDITEILDIYRGLPIESIIYTDIERDGTLKGYNVETLKDISEYTNIPVIASGGFRDVNDIKKLLQIPNLKGFIIGKAFYEKNIKLKEILEYIDNDKTS
jgi:phosphoribosylformimino-5-aminoimidazole carboxamide ribotide isomerase